MCLQAISILRCAVAVGEGFSRPGLISEGPPLSLFDLLLANRSGSMNLMFPLSVGPLTWFICLLGCRSFHFCSSYSPPSFFGCFGLFMVGRASSSKIRNIEVRRIWSKL